MCVSACVGVCDAPPARPPPPHTALGITWGGRDRCDASDPLCGPDGKLRGELPPPAPPPALPATAKVTDIVELDVRIGKQSAGTISIGLFGEASPENVRQVVLLCENRYRSKPTDYPTGLTWGTATRVDQEDHSVSLGLARDDQAAAYARRLDLRKAPDDFQPADPPDQNEEDNELTENIAGMVSVSKGGLSRDLELVLSSANSEPQADGFGALMEAMKPKKVVVGAVLNSESMAILARLSSLPVQRYAGGLPGRNGKPMLRVYITSKLGMNAPRFNDIMVYTHVRVCACMRICHAIYNILHADIGNKMDM